MGDLRVEIRVTPGARRPSVGGDHDGALVVKVAARAVDGKATDAALAAVAAALGQRRRSVTLISGATSRRKSIRIEGDPARIRAAVDELRRSG